MDVTITTTRRWMRRWTGVTLALALCATMFDWLGGRPMAAAEAATHNSIGTLRLQGDISSVRDPGRYRYAILNAWEADKIPALKAANPAIKVLVYKDMSSTRSYAVRNGVDDAVLPTGVGHAYAERNHPEWFVTLPDGKRLEWAGYGGHFQMDVGNPSYQDTWLANVAKEVPAKGWDGVFVDNTMASLRWYLSGRPAPSQYPNDDAYRPATDSFLAKVGPALKAKGLMVIPNISDADYTTWDRWVSYSSGVSNEHYSKYGETADRGFIVDKDWQWRMGFQARTQAAGKVFLGITYSPMSDTRAMRYSRASFLLNWDGGPSTLIFHPGRGVDGYSDEWAADIGTPINARYQVGPAFRRDYTEGTVVVNPSSSVPATVNLGRAYLLPDGTATASVTLPPATGLVLPSATVPSGPGSPTAAGPAPSPAAAPAPQSASPPGSPAPPPPPSAPVPPPSAAGLVPPPPPPPPPPAAAAHRPPPAVRRVCRRVRRGRVVCRTVTVRARRARVAPARNRARARAPVRRR